MQCTPGNSELSCKDDCSYEVCKKKTPTTLEIQAHTCSCLQGQMMPGLDKVVFMEASGNHVVPEV